MADTLVVRTGDDLDWAPFTIPAGTPAVSMVTLRTDARGGRTVLVRFPADFERAEAGRYACAEEFVVLEGTLQMNGSSYRAPRWVYVPAGATRAETSARDEVLALAHFDGPARWSSGPGTGEDVDDDGLEHDFRAVSPFGRARLLRHGDDATTWFVEASPGTTAPADLEICAIAVETWAFVPAGEPIPSLAGPCIVRIEEDR